MLIKITNYCSMGCSHCLEDSTIKGEHMTWDAFQRALDCTARMEVIAWQMGIPRIVLLSGGECTEHPDVVHFAEEVVKRGCFLILITNGMWLGDEKLRDALLRPEWKKCMSVQVTNDPRFYPKAPPHFDDDRIIYVPALTQLVTLGRAGRKKNIDAMGVPMKNAPTSFNFRSLTRSYGSVEKAVAMLRARALSGLSGHCSPSISNDGSVVAGESRFCFKIGTVDSTMAAMTKATVEMKCNACGLVDNLTLEQKRAIGESNLYAGGES